MKEPSPKGFTLVELLVVVAILGVLTSIVLVSLTTANSRGKDGAVRENMANLRTQGQLYYNDNSNYGSNGSNPVNSADCTSGIGGTVFSDTRITKQIAAITFANGGGGVVCNVAAFGAGYAMSAKLPSGNYFCIDSNGVGKMESSALVSSDMSCP